MLYSPGGQMPLKFTAPLLLATVFAMPRLAEAGMIEYLASSGVLPQSPNWVTSATPPIASVSGGVLTLDATVQPRGNWLTNAAALPGGTGVYMRSKVQVVSEAHTRTDRGVGIMSVQQADGAFESYADVYAWTDRIIVNDSNDDVVATYFMDTTSRFHTYRVELVLSDFKVFVDGNEVLSGTTPLLPTSTNRLRGIWGDPSAGSVSVSKWTSVRVGSLNGPSIQSVPEPGSLVLLGSGALGMLWARRRRRAESDA